MLSTLDDLLLSWSGTEVSHFPPVERLHGLFNSFDSSHVVCHDPLPKRRSGGP